MMVLTLLRPHSVQDVCTHTPSSVSGTRVSGGQTLALRKRTPFYRLMHGGSRMCSKPWAVSGSPEASSSRSLWPRHLHVLLERESWRS